MSNSLFSIIVLNYNNFDLLFEMIDSIYMQEYNNIELIIFDDASNYFDENKIKNYVKKFDKKINLKIVVNKNNIGTVKTINKALKYLKGQYVLITASDDSLYDSDVITNYVKCFEKENTDIVVSQWLLCDENLKFIENFIPENKFKIYNHNSKKLLLDMCLSNRFGSGATAYKTQLLKSNPFNEKYIYLEDWPYWLELLFKNYKIYFNNFNGLYHRGGGISKSAELSPSKLVFYEELLKTYSYEIIPNLKKFSNYNKYKILKSYKFNIEHYSRYFDISKYENELYKTLIKERKVLPYWIVNELHINLINKFKIIYKYNKIVLNTFVLTLITSFLCLKYVKNNDFKLLFFIIIYIIIYTFVVFFSKLRSRKK